MENQMIFSFSDYCDTDFNEVENLWKETGLGSSFRGDTNEVILRTINAGGKFIVMKSAGHKIIGTSWITNDGRRLYLHHFGILPAFQGKKLSVPLLEKSLEFAKNKDLQIKLEVGTDNLKAISLYRKYGFKDLGNYIVLIIRDLK